MYFDLPLRPRNQDTSTRVGEGRTLTSSSITGLANYIKNGKVNSILVLSGAGISTSAGVPDFRSPDTGIYSILQRHSIPFGEAIFDLSYFMASPQTFYSLVSELKLIDPNFIIHPNTPTKYRPTYAHWFVKFLDEKGLLYSCFTQNIDMLERQTGLDSHNLVEAHGTFATQTCTSCTRQQKGRGFFEAIAAKRVALCEYNDCNGVIKPDIVFFGEPLPAKFFHMARAALLNVDLVLIMGTSLKTYPFAGLPDVIPEHVPRVLINDQQVGTIGSRIDDVAIIDKCDAGVKRLLEALGWAEEFKAFLTLNAPYCLERNGPSREDEISDCSLNDDTLDVQVRKITEESDDLLRRGKHIIDTLNEDNHQQNCDDNEIGPGLYHVFPYLRKSQ